MVRGGDGEGGGGSYPGKVYGPRNYVYVHEVVHNPALDVTLVLVYHHLEIKIEK